MGVISSKDLPIPEDSSLARKSDNKKDIPDSFLDELSKKKTKQFNEIHEPPSSDESSSDKEKSLDNQQLEQEIEQFIEKWFHDNKEIDLGNIEILNQKIDIIPDSMEKLIYKKALLIGVTFIKKILSESKITFLNQEIKIQISDKSN